MAWIGPDPSAALDPEVRIDGQLHEALRAHVRRSWPEGREQVRAALLGAGIAFPDEVLVAFPEALPAALAQRVAVALAFLHAPALVVADDPTARLEPAAHSAMVHDIATAAHEVGAGLVWLTPDPLLLARVASRVAILYAGRLVEEGALDDVLRQPAHPYTRALLDALPGRSSRSGRLRPSPGDAPSVRSLPSGCAFRARCGHVMQACVAAPDLMAIGRPDAGRAVRCHAPLLRPGIAP